MSGGSFDYLCWSTDLASQKGTIEEMAKAIEAYGHPAAAKAADHTRAVLAAFKAAEVIADQLRDVWHAVEWHHSSDWGEDGVLEALQGYGKGMT